MKSQNNQRFLFFFITIQIIFFTIPTLVFANTTGEIENKVDEYINAYLEMNQFSGSILIAQNGKVLVSKGYGMANHEYDVPNDKQTKFRIGSLTKQFTAMAIMLLEKQNLISVDDSITKYISDYPGGDKIKIKHLLTHTSGIPDHTNLPDFNQDRRVYQCNIIKTIESFKNLPLEFSPGEKFSYSNSGYMLLGHIIEEVTETSFENYIKQNIFKPLNMIHSGIENEQKIIKHIANGYAMNGSEIINASYRNMSNAHASGALYSTIEDLYLWDRALYSDELINQKSVERMFTPFKGPYGFGWGIVDIFNRKMVGHNGETEGFSSNITRFINDDVCIIILSNLEGVPVGKIGVDLAAILFGEKYSIPKVRKTITLGSNILKDYVGKYEVTKNFHFTIKKENSQLYCQATGQGRLEIFPQSENMFFLKEVDAEISFIRNKENEVEKLILHQGGREIPAKKIE